jgi:hypothetical protein
MAEEETPTQPSEQELADMLREELQRMKVSDLLVQTLYTVSSLGYHKLSPDHRDLEQARLAIDGMRALLPVLKGSVSDDVFRDFSQVVANMQLAYADAVSAPTEAAAEPQADESAEEAPKGEARTDDLEPVEEDELGGESG